MSEAGKLRDQFAEYVRAHGLKSTQQRDLIVELFLRSSGHISIDDLLSKVRRKNPKVGYATVYRTLKLLTECGVAFERRFGDGLTRYELADEESHHDHLICVECQSIIEFEEPRIERIQEEVAEQHGFRLLSHKHEMYGVCASCQAKLNRASGTR